MSEPRDYSDLEKRRMSEFTLGFIAGLEAAAGFADYMGGDRYQRPDWNRRDPHARGQQTIEAQHLRARSLATIYRLRADELRASQRQLPSNPLPDDPANGDENAPGAEKR